MHKVEEKALLRMVGEERENYINLSGKYVAYLREEMDLYMQSKNQAGVVSGV